MPNQVNLNFYLHFIFKIALERELLRFCFQVLLYLQFPGNIKHIYSLFKFHIILGLDFKFLSFLKLSSFQYFETLLHSKFPQRFYFLEEKFNLSIMYFVKIWDFMISSLVLFLVHCFFINFHHLFHFFLYFYDLYHKYFIR